jgi:hypothetical protein
MPENISKVIAHAFADELDSAFSRITHCLEQLTDEQIWWRPRSDMNSIGNLVLHLNGNVRQLIISTIGGVPDDRDRPAEFAARNAIPKAVLLEQLTITIDSAKSVISHAPLEELCRVRRVREFDWSGLQAIVRSVSHFRGHTQEIIHQTRTILGEHYRFAGQR